MREHAGSCPGRPPYKGICECGAERPSSMVAVPVEKLKRLQQDRDELLAALKGTLVACRCDDDGSPCELCDEAIPNGYALIARINGRHADG